MSAEAQQLVRFLQQENMRLQEENRSLREENLNLHRYMDALEDLYWATQRITSEENLLNLLDQILHNALGVLRAEDGSLLLLDHDTGELVFVLVHGNIRSELQGYRISGDRGIAGWVASQGEPLIVNQPRQDYRFSLEVDHTFNFVTRSILCVPMISRNRLIGVIELLNKRDDEEFNQADATLLSILGYIAGTALEEMDLRLQLLEKTGKLDRAI
jgi:GAF domain-containing protein